VTKSGTRLRCLKEDCGYSADAGEPGEGEGGEGSAAAAAKPAATSTP
jgi:hypothetical protein